MMIDWKEIRIDQADYTSEEFSTPFNKHPKGTFVSDYISNEFYSLKQRLHQTEDLVIVLETMLKDYEKRILCLEKAAFPERFI